ncbi:MAG: hypothetical protein RL477_2126 [Pseudomonadota bacterium]
MSGTQARRAANRRGLRAEALAAVWLNLRGYRVAARRFSCPLGEIDLVVRRGRTVAFVEVKSRADAARAGEAITAAKRARIAAAARAWIAAHPEDGARDCRFDAILMRPWKLPLLIEDAWRE